MTGSEMTFVTDQLTKLEGLRSEGTISDSEFEALKAKLIVDTIRTAPAFDVATSAPTVSKYPQNPDETSSPAISKMAAASRFMDHVGMVFTVVCVIALIGLFLFPLVMEGVTGPCAAVESRYYRQFLGSDGAYTETLVKSFYKDLPPSFACSLIYYGKIKAPGY